MIPRLERPTIVFLVVGVGLTALLLVAAADDGGGDGGGGVKGGGIMKETNEVNDDEDDHILTKRTRRLLLRFFRRRLRIPHDSTMALAIQISRPNIYPGLFNQEDGFITDAVLELPLALDLDEFSKAMYFTNETAKGKSGVFTGTERCFLYDKMEWLFAFLTQNTDQNAHSCVLKLICETHAIHTFYPHYPISIVFELIHLLLTPSLGSDDPCFKDFLVAENIGKSFGRCAHFLCPLSLGDVLLHNFFPSSQKGPSQMDMPMPQPPHTISSLNTGKAKDRKHFKKFSSAFESMNVPS